MTTPYQMALLIKEAYENKHRVKTICDDDFLDYIESTIAYPKKHFKHEFAIAPRLKIDTEANVEALLEVEGGELKIAVAGSDSLHDWFFNFLHLKDSLFLDLGWSKRDRGYKIGYETLTGYILKYLCFYQNLVEKGIVDPIERMTIAGHSAGGRIADRVAYNLAYSYRPGGKGIPIKLYTMASPIFKEFFTPEKLQRANIQLQRYVTEDDPISQLPAKLFNRKGMQEFTRVIPRRELPYNPHAIETFIVRLKELEEYSKPSRE